MYRDLPSGIKRLPRSLSSILVQGTEFNLHQSSELLSPTRRITKQTKIQIGVATCTNARSLHVGEAWAVGGTDNLSSSLSSGYAQIGVLDSKENRAFEILNSPQASSNRNWSEMTLKKFLANNNNSKSQLRFSGYASGRGAFSAVTPASIVASKLASQFLVSSSAASAMNHKNISTSNAGSFKLVAGADKADVAFSAYGADFALKEEMLKCIKQTMTMASDSKEKYSKEMLTSVSQSGCRGVWVNISSAQQINSDKNATSPSSPLIKLEAHNVGDARALLIHSKTKAHGKPKVERSPLLKSLQEKTKILPNSFTNIDSKKRFLDDMGFPVKPTNAVEDKNGENEKMASSTSPSQIQEEPWENPAYLQAISDELQKDQTVSAMHHKLLPRRLRLDPLTVDHRPLRPEEARRIGRAAIAEDDQSKNKKNNNINTQTSKIASNTIRASDHYANTSAHSNNNNNQKKDGFQEISRDVITDDELIRGDFAADVSRAFGHFHLKSCQELSPDEQMLTCRPETVTRYLEVGDVVVLGNKSVFTGSIPGQRFVGGWSVTLDSVAAHVINEFDENSGQMKTPNVQDVARDIVQLALLSGAEHNLSVVVMKIVEEEDNLSNETGEHKNNSFSGFPSTEYAIPGEVFPFLTNQENYALALRRDAWRLGYSSLGRFAEARGEVLSGRYAAMQETLRTHGGSKEKPSIECPQSLWSGGLTQEIVSPMMLTTHPGVVSNLIREMQAEMDWCELEAKKQ